MNVHREMRLQRTPTSGRVNLSHPPVKSVPQFEKPRTGLQHSLQQNTLHRAC